MSDNMSYHMNSTTDGFSSTFDNDTSSEPTVVNSHDIGYYSRCYWSGKAFLKYMLSDTVLRKSQDWWTGDDLETELSEAFINFPYALCTEKIDALKAVEIPRNNSHHTHGNHWEFATKLGVILDVEPAMKAKLAGLVQSRGGTITGHPEPDQIMPPSPPHSFEMDMEDGSRIALYTMKLNEWGAQRGRRFEFKDDFVSVLPPLWQVQVTIDGKTYTGRAKKKTSAMHIASKQACERLGIRV